MGCDTYKGSDFNFLAQLNGGAYRAVPTPVGALALKFSEAVLDRKPVRQNDPTITSFVVPEKSDEVDETPDGSLTAIACLNDALFWFTMMFGAPDTTGAGPYVHTFTLTNDCKPDALFELSALRSGGVTPWVDRYLGGMVKSWQWDLMSVEQNWMFELLMAAQVRPKPATKFDATPTRLDKARAMAAKGLIYDVFGASTLGKISGATVNLNLNPQPMPLADGLSGYSDVQPGDIELSGTVTALFTDAGLAVAADTHTSKKLVLETASKAGTESLKLTIPAVEFGEPAMEVRTRMGIVRQYNWKAHGHVDPITLVLTNGIETL